jgi:hypothetical protein
VREQERIRRAQLVDGRIRIDQPDAVPFGKPKSLTDRERLAAFIEEEIERMADEDGTVAIAREIERAVLPPEPVK